MPGLTKIKGGFASVDALNENFDIIESLFEDVLFRKGDSVPNEMDRSIDMNSNRVFNLPENPQSDFDAVPWVKVKFIVESLESVDFQNIVDQVESIRDATEGFRNETESFRGEAEGFRNEAEEFRDEAETIVESDLQQEITIEHEWDFTGGLKIDGNNATHESNIKNHLENNVLPLKTLNSFIMQSDVSGSGQINDIAYGNGKVVAVGWGDGSIHVSDDNGRTFTRDSIGGAGTVFYGVATDGDSLWIAVGDDGNGDSMVYTSGDNADSWTESSITGDDDEILYGVTFNDEDPTRVVAVGNNGIVVRGESPGVFDLVGDKDSIDGLSPDLRDVAWIDTGTETRFVGVGTNGNIVVSNETASSWTVEEDAFNDGADFEKIVSDRSNVLAVGENETLAWSSSGGSFTNLDSPVTGDFKAVGVDLENSDKLWTVGHENGYVFSSLNPSEGHWFAVDIKAEDVPNGITFGNDTWFVTVGNDGDIYVSPYSKTILGSD